MRKLQDFFHCKISYKEVKNMEKICVVSYPNVELLLNLIIIKKNVTACVQFHISSFTKHYRVSANDLS